MGIWARQVASNYLSTYATGLEAFMLRLDEGGGGACWTENMVREWFSITCPPLEADSEDD